MSDTTLKERQKFMVELVSKMVSLDLHGLGQFRKVRVKCVFRHDSKISHSEWGIVLEGHKRNSPQILQMKAFREYESTELLAVEAFISWAEKQIREATLN